LPRSGDVRAAAPTFATSVESRTAEGRFAGRTRRTIPVRPRTNRNGAKRSGARADVAGAEGSTPTDDGVAAILARMRIAFLGFGLIAGSIARSVRASSNRAAWTMAAWSPSGDGPEQALDDGTIDLAAGSAAEALRGADLVVLAAPVPACLAAMDELAAGLGTTLSESAVITDVASTKALLLQHANSLGLRYVGGHPMAGVESAGYAAGRADLFVDRPWVVVPGRSAEAVDVERVESLIRACGAKAIRMDAEAHDRAVAGISHLPLLLAAALAETVAGLAPGGARADWVAASRLAASGWRDMTRLARGDPGMGAGIVVTNASALASRLRDLRAVLEGWQLELERSGGPEGAAIEDRLRAVKARLDAP
jgi:prephenate dehydrogenase